MLRYILVSLLFMAAFKPLAFGDDANLAVTDADIDAVFSEVFFDEAGDVSIEYADWDLDCIRIEILAEDSKMTEETRSVYLTGTDEDSSDAERRQSIAAVLAGFVSTRCGAEERIFD